MAASRSCREARQTRGDSQERLSQQTRRIRRVRVSVEIAARLRKLSKAYKNGPEFTFAELAASKGWTVTKRGWPDFLCFGPNNEIVAVEVKPSHDDSLKYDQIRCMDALQAHGVKCYTSDGKTLKPYDRQRLLQNRYRNRQKRLARLEQIGGRVE